MRRGGEQRLIERNGQDLMLAVVAHIANAEQPAVAGLILKIESPVLRVGELVVDIVAAEHEWAEQIPGGIITIFSLGDIGQQGLKRGCAARRLGRKGGSKRIGNSGALGSVDRRNKRRRQGDAKGAVK